jgi:phage terminase large subunit-like protein
VVGVDPAATNKNITAKTSRSSVATVARDPFGRSFLIDLHVGYVEIFTLYDWIFGTVQKFKGLIHLVVFEKAAFQTVLEPLLNAEKIRRNIFVRIEGRGAGGDKSARIRTCLAPELQAGRFYVTEDFEKDFLEEKNTFPQSKKMDILDSIEKSMRELITPESEEDEGIRMNAEEEWANAIGRNATTGY